VYTHGAATIEVTLQLEPGVTKMNLVMSCPDPDSTEPIAVRLKKHDTGLLGRIELHPTVRKEAGVVETQYGSITNLHPTHKVTAMVVAHVKPLKAGNHSCNLKLDSMAVATNDLSFAAVDPPEVSRCLREGLSFIPQGSSRIGVRALTMDVMSVHQSESVAVELELTISPEAGDQAFNLSFKSETKVRSVYNAAQCPDCNLPSLLATWITTGGSAALRLLTLAMTSSA
jgi:hypothetical protein